MEMEDKESTEYGSPGGSSEVHSQPSSGGVGEVPEITNMAAKISMEKNAGATGSASAAGGGAGAAGGGIFGGSGELALARKKRGRPRKYDSEGNLSAAYLRSKAAATAAAAAAAAHAPPQQGGFTLSTPPSFEYSSGPKKGRGKISGSNWKTLAALGELFTTTAGGDFTPHVVTVYNGEDVAGKILTFAQKGSRGVCVLSANGSVSNVTIRQPGSSGGLLTYEGRFEILTLTGSYTISDNGGIRSRTGGLSVSLASPDGRVIGGGVAGLLMAASPVQIVVGSFVPNGYKFHKKKQHAEPLIPSPAAAFPPATVTAAIPISQAPPETNAYTNTAPTSHFPAQSQGDGDNSLSNKDHPNSASTDTADWNSSGPSSEARPYPDINLSIPVEEM